MGVIQTQIWRSARGLTCQISQTLLAATGCRFVRGTATHLLINQDASPRVVLRTYGYFLGWRERLAPVTGDR